MRKSSLAEKTVVSNFLTALKNKGIFYCILRNYEGIPDYVGHDIDIFFQKRNIKEAKVILTGIAAESGLALRHIHDLEHVMSLFFAPMSEGDILKIDLYHGALTWHGLGFIDESEFIARCKTTNGMAVPSCADEAVTLCATSLIWGLFFKERYRGRTRELLRDDADHRLALSLFQNILGDSSGKNLLDSLLRGDEIDGRFWGKALRNATRRNAIRKNPIKALARITRYWLYQIYGMIFLTGRIMECAPGKEYDEAIAEMGAAAGFFGDVSRRAMEDILRMPFYKVIITALAIRKRLKENYLIVLATARPAVPARNEAIKEFFLRVIIQPRKINAPSEIKDLFFANMQTDGNI
jgi:hypothetical protein